MNTINYNTEPVEIIEKGNIRLNSFITKNIFGNIDWNTVGAFGSEWEKFSSFDRKDIDTVGNDYFDIVPFEKLPKNSKVLDVGCGSGRWARFLSDKVGAIEAIDPSKAAFVASKQLVDLKNVRVSIADTDHIPFPIETFDLVYSLGVLHHIPDTTKALRECCKYVKPGGYFLVYLYYALDNRGFLFKSLFRISNFFRGFISKLPDAPKKTICDLLAIIIYLPLILLSKLFQQIGLKKLSNKIPLSYYRKTSFNIIRNDSLDRFGTPLEQRFTKDQIYFMMKDAGLKHIKFSDNPPYWHAIGQK